MPVDLILVAFAPRGFTSFINDVLPGEYTIAVTSDCDEWTINLNEF